MVDLSGPNKGGDERLNVFSTCCRRESIEKDKFIILCLCNPRLVPFAHIPKGFSIFNYDLLTLFQSDNFIFSQMHLDVHKYFFKVSFQLLIGFKHTISKSSRSTVITFINAFMLTSWTIIKVIKMFTVTIGKSDQMINSVWLNFTKPPKKVLR